MPRNSNFSSLCYLFLVSSIFFFFLNFFFFFWFSDFFPSKFPSLSLPPQVPAALQQQIITRGDQKFNEFFTRATLLPYNLQTITSTTMPTPTLRSSTTTTTIRATEKAMESSEAAMEAVSAVWAAGLRLKKMKALFHLLAAQDRFLPFLLPLLISDSHNNNNKEIIAKMTLFQQLILHLFLLACLDHHILPKFNNNNNNKQTTHWELSKKKKRNTRVFQFLRWALVLQARDAVLQATFFPQPDYLQRPPPRSLFQTRTETAVWLCLKCTTL